MVRSVGLAVVAAGVAAVSYPVYLHLLGYRAYGLWLVLSSVITFSQLGNLGLSQAVAKYVAEEQAKNNLAGVREYVSTACAMILGSGAIVVSIVTLTRSQLVGLLGLHGSDARLSLAMLPVIALLSIYLFLTDLSNNVLNGLGRIDLCNTCSLCAQVLAVTISVPLMLFYRSSIWSLLMATIAAYALTHVISNLLIRRICGQSLYSIRALKMSRVRKLMSFGGWMVGSSVISMLINPINRTLLARFGGLSIVPIYDVGLNAASRLRGLIETGHRALSTEVSRISAATVDSSEAQVNRLIQKSTRPVIVIAIPVLLFLSFVPLLLQLWLGTRYVPEISTTVRIMVVANYLSLFATPAYYVLIGRGRARDIFAHFVIQCLMNVMLIGTVVNKGAGLSATAATASYACGIVISAAFLIWREKCSRGTRQIASAAIPVTSLGQASEISQ